MFVVGGARLLLLTRIWSLERLFLGPAPKKNARARWRVPHQAQPNRARSRARALSAVLRTKSVSYIYLGGVA